MLAICCAEPLAPGPDANDAIDASRDAGLDASRDDADATTRSTRLYVAQDDDVIVSHALDVRDGTLVELGRTPIAGGASFLAVDARGVLGALVLEDGHEVVAFGVDVGGVVHERGPRRNARGLGPTHVSIDPSGRHALVADYGSGDVASFAFSSDGTLEEATTALRAGDNAHQVVVSPSGSLALVPCKGADHVAVLGFDAATGLLAPRSLYATEPGQGPRHLVLGADGRYAYLANELGSRLEVLALDEAHATLTHRQSISTLPAGDATPNTAAEIALGVGERFVYVSNRGHDSIAIFEIGADHLVTPRGHVLLEARRPRSFAIDPSGRWLFAGAQADDVIVRFRIEDDGALTRIGTTPTSGSPTFVGIFSIASP